MKGYQFLVGTTHFNDEDNLLYVTMEVYVRKSPVGPVILVKWAPIMKGGLVVKRIDDTPGYVEDVVQMTGTVIPEDAESSDPEDLESSELTGADSIDVDEFGRQTTGSVGPHQHNAVRGRSSRKARGHARRKKGDGSVTVGGAPSKQLECVAKCLCLTRGEVEPISHRGCRSTETREGNSPRGTEV